MNTARVLLHPRRARPFYGRHPWVYSGAIAAIDGNPADGDVVEVYSHGGTFIARGLYNSNSRIRVRLYTWDAEELLDATFFRHRLQQAIEFRRDVLRLTGVERACRLVFSEGDALSGITVDYYDQWLVVQFTALGLAQRRAELTALLTELANPAGIILRTERGISQLEGLVLQDGILCGPAPPDSVTINEHDIRFLVNLREGQKTGFYLDQRDNRQTVAQYAIGRRVLDAFCYTGGFGLHAAKAGAAEVIGIDVSATALELARQNATQNGLGNISFKQAEVFPFLESAVHAGQRFGLIILDPPKFARQQRAVEGALRAYRRLQMLALLLLDPDGILVTCCCSGLIE